MAQQGKKMEEIIAHYYQNVNIAKWNEDSFKKKHYELPQFTKHWTPWV